MPVPDLTPEHDQIDARRRARAAARAACRRARARSPARRPRCAARPPRASRPPPDPPPWRRCRAASAGSATPKMPTRTPPTVSSRDGVDVLWRARCCSPGAPGRHTPRPAADVGLGQPGGERRAERPSASPRNVARAVVRLLLLGACCSRGTTARPRRPAGPGRLRARPSAPARRSGRRRPADRWCSRTARASRGPRPCRRCVKRRSPGGGRADRRSATPIAAAAAASEGKAEDRGRASGALLQSGAAPGNSPARPSAGA